ncbi:hypothetical protein OG618_37265 (plasmid) [Kitasatospora sp. NBC_01246]|uniref:hypothetical protein n=1 Tax=Kitasatospora sp. NBC_01246 TaxID=2903570 RepID=UPI002E3083DA|nr:hypothetical protein [Kitasatospora sp. NBC_01246]
MTADAIPFAALAQPAPALPTLHHYRAETSGIRLGHYTHIAAAQAHAEDFAAAALGGHDFEWIPAELESGEHQTLHITLHGAQHATEYTVTAVPVMDHYDPSAEL